MSDRIHDEVLVTHRPSDLRALQSKRSGAIPAWSVAFAGDERVAEWSQMVAELRQWVEVTVVSEPRQLVADVGWDLILLAPRFPGDQSFADALDVVSRLPLTPVWLVVGSWLEGETRTGRAWEGVPRYYRDQVLPEILRQWEAGQEGGPAVPATETADEVAFRDAAAPLPRREGTALVWAAAPPERDYLIQLCHQLGFHAMAWDETQPMPLARLVVYDAVACFDQARADVERLRRQQPQARLVVLSSFPREVEASSWRSVGADFVLGKPFRLPHFAAVTR